MKLLLCKSCQDVVKLTSGNFRKCQCGLSSGRYLEDDYHAEVKGVDAVVICFLNTELLRAVIGRPKFGGRGIEFTAFVAAEDHASVTYR